MYKERVSSMSDLKDSIQKAVNRQKSEKCTRYMSELKEQVNGALKDINKLKKVVYSDNKKQQLPKNTTFLTYDDCVKYLEAIGYRKVTETTFLNEDKTKRADIIQIGTAREISFDYV